ncbi:MAG: hypothetical protein IPJ71_18430 [Bdellovibrionales bacterium]|nr:hypothetical protein [Bdellovibrionales bacterium]
MKAEVKNRAFALYVHEGKSLRKIIQEVQISRSTVEQWCKKEDWVTKRRKHWQGIAQKICEQQSNQRIGKQASIAGKLHKMVQMIHAQHMAFYEGKLPRSAIKYSIRDLCRLAISVHQIGLHELQCAEGAINLNRKN